MLTTKGDVLGYDTAANRIPVGANGTVLTADSTNALGVSYQAPTAGGITLKDGITTIAGVTSLTVVGGAVSVASTDPDWTAVGLLILADSIGSGNVAVDDSSHAFTLSGPGNSACFISSGGPFGGPYIDLANVPGGTVAGFDVSVPVTAPIDLSTGDYTVEGWFYPRDGGATPECLFFALNGSTNFNIGNYTGFLYAGIDGGGGLSASAVSLNTWHHVAIVMISNQWVVYLDGVATNSPIASSRTSWASGTFWVGGYNSGALCGGGFSNVRITKGVGRYTSGFTPPTAPFPVAAAGAAVLHISPSTVVASLPGSAGAGARNFVTDATSTTFLSIVAGGGSNKVPVVFDGTNWVIG